MTDRTVAEEEQRLRQRAMRRLALALTVIAAAIIALAVLDHYGGRGKAPGPERKVMETSPAPVPSRQQPPLHPAEAPVPPNDQAAADLPPPPPPPDVDEEPITPAERQAIPAASTTKRAPAAEPMAGATPAASVSTASQQQAKMGKPPRATAPAEPRQGFVVQLGLFTSIENAQSLHARLKQQGIPAFLETRVVVGPFRDRAEADAAQRKLRALGVSGVISQRD
jgi:DedD protein